MSIVSQMLPIPSNYYIFVCLVSQDCHVKSIEKYTRWICNCAIYYGGMMTEISISYHSKCREISRDFVGHFEWCNLAQKW